MALPTIVFNASTGSDTAASGAGPSTALTGTGASTTATSGVVDVSADSPDLSGVATDGSAVLWVKSSSGRQYSKITAVDNTAKTVTCQSTFANTEGSRTWGIGGKRATFDHADSRTAFANALGGWSIQTETDQTITSTLTVSASGASGDGILTILGDSESSRRKITGSNNGDIVSQTGGQVAFRNLIFGCSNATKTIAVGFSQAGNGPTWAYNCVFCDPSNTVKWAYNSISGNGLYAYDCDMSGATDIGARLASNFSVLFMVGCTIRNNGSHGISIGQLGILTAVHCLIAGNTGDGIYDGNGQYITVRLIDSTVANNSGDGVDVGSQTVQSDFVILGNNIANNTGTGLKGSSLSPAYVIANDYNNLYGNGTARSNFTAGANDTAVDPQFVNAGSGNFAIGTNLQASGWPPSSRGMGAGQSSTRTYVDSGAAQRQESSGGSGSGTIVVSGGMRPRCVDLGRIGSTIF